VNSRNHRAVFGARLLRKKSTDPEMALWLFLSNKGLCGYKFRRQHPIHGYILDFYCPEHKLAVEIDGKIHDNLKEHDLKRQQFLEGLGISFIRFSNDDVINSTETVLKMIKNKLATLKPVPAENEGSPLHKVERG
jgi:very-short-patch-repair endonuclease